MVQIWNLDNINQDSREELKRVFSKKKLTNKDREFILEMMKAVYIKDDFFNKDSEDIIEAKIAELKELIWEQKK